MISLVLCAMCFFFLSFFFDLIVHVTLLTQLACSIGLEEKRERLIIRHD